MNHRFFFTFLFLKWLYNSQEDGEVTQSTLEQCKTLASGHSLYDLNEDFVTELLRKQSEVTEISQDL